MCVRRSGGVINCGVSYAGHTRTTHAQRMATQLTMTTMYASTLPWLMSHCAARRLRVASASTRLRADCVVEDGWSTTDVACACCASAPASTPAIAPGAPPVSPTCPVANVASSAPSASAPLTQTTGSPEPRCFSALRPQHLQLFANFFSWAQYKCGEHVRQLSFLRRFEGCDDTVQSQGVHSAHWRFFLPWEQTVPWFEAVLVTESASLFGGRSVDGSAANTEASNFGGWSGAASPAAFATQTAAHPGSVPGTAPDPSVRCGAFTVSACVTDGGCDGAPPAPMARLFIATALN